MPLAFGCKPSPSWSCISWYDLWLAVVTQVGVIPKASQGHKISIHQYTIASTTYCFYNHGVQGQTSWYLHKHIFSFSYYTHISQPWCWKIYYKTGSFFFLQANIGIHILQHHVSFFASQVIPVDIVARRPPLRGSMPCALLWAESRLCQEHCLEWFEGFTALFEGSSGNHRKTMGIHGGFMGFGMGFTLW